MGDCCHKKHQPRDEKEIKQLTNRLHRMVGQLNGIENMLKENRYCGDILVQVGSRECFAGIWIYCFAGTLEYVCR